MLVPPMCPDMTDFVQERSQMAPTLHGSLACSLHGQPVSKLVCKAQAWQVPSVCSVHRGSTAQPDLYLAKDSQALRLPVIRCEARQGGSLLFSISWTQSLATTTTDQITNVERRNRLPRLSDGFYQQVPGGLERAEAVKRKPALKGEVAETLSVMSVYDVCRKS
jgi:hypothetical protein